MFTLSSQYRALGNAIPPVMMWYIAKEVVNYLKKKKIAKKTLIKK